MKIAILTQPLHTNYGGILQAYAVQKILKDRGHEVVTLDIQCKDINVNMSLYAQMRRYIATLLLFFIKRIRKKDIIWPYNTKKRNRKLVIASIRNFVNRIIRLSPEIRTEEALMKYIKEADFDAYVVGSDQVWRPQYSPHIYWFFLDFLSDDFKGKRIAFSASFGTSEWEFSKEQTDYLKPFAKKFNAISVREQSGVDLCKRYFDIPAIQVLDPTMMLTPKDYAKLVNLDKHHTHSMEGTIFSYVLDDTNEIRTIVDGISATLGLSVQQLGIHNYDYGPYTSEKQIVKYFPKPVSQWLRGFQETEFVVTDSFHGTVFSILHHKPFVVIANPKRGIARIETILKMFGLEDRLVDSTDVCVKEWLINGILWDEIDSKLKKNREVFNAFICKTLQ